MPLVMSVEHNLDKFKARMFKTKDIRAAARQAIELAGDKALEEFDKTVKTWQTETSFWYRPVGTRDGMQLTFFTDNPKYKFVDEGTSVRYATMTPDFIARTKPNVISSFAGKGGLSFVSRQHPHDGIDPRNFSKIITQRTGPAFRGALQRELSEMLETGKITKKAVKRKITHGGSSAGAGRAPLEKARASAAAQYAGRVRQLNVGQKQKKK